MEIKLNSQDTKKLNKLIETNQINSSLGEMLNDFILNCPRLNDISTEEDFEQAIIDYFDLNMSNSETNFYFEKCIKEGIKNLDLSIVKTNPYFKKITLPKIHGKFSYLSEHLYKNQPIAYDDISVDDETYLEQSKIGYFNEEVIYPSLVQNNVVWMSLHPNEIITMKDPIKKAHGNVLVLGLGIGYFQYMISEKAEVKAITIIEKEQTVIDMFLKDILPQFPQKSKIDIIKSDALKVDFEKIDYDYCFIDLWHNPSDGLPLYIELVKGVDLNKTDYWLETSLIAYLRRIVISLFEEKQVGYTDKDYLNPKNAQDKLYSKVYFAMKKITFNSYNEIHEFLSDSSLKHFIKFTL